MIFDGWLALDPRGLALLKLAALIVGLFITVLVAAGIAAVRGLRAAETCDCAACGDKGCWACDLRVDLATMTIIKAPVEPNVDPVAEIHPGEWAKLEQRLLTRMAAGMGLLVASAVAPSCAGPPQALELEVETRCLEMARVELRASEFVPLTPGGQVIWFQLATALSHYMRSRLGLPLDPEKKP